MLFTFVFFLFRVIALNIITFFIEEITSFFNKFLNFGSAFSSSFIIRNSRVIRGKERRKSVSIYIRIIITITITGIRIRIRITISGFNFNSNLF